MTWRFFVFLVLFAIGAASLDLRVEEQNKIRSAANIALDNPRISYLKDHETGKYYRLTVDQQVLVDEVPETAVKTPIINPKQ